MKRQVKAQQMMQIDNSSFFVAAPEREIGFVEISHLLKAAEAVRRGA